MPNTCLRQTLNDSNCFLPQSQRLFRKSLKSDSFPSRLRELEFFRRGNSFERNRVADTGEFASVGRHYFDSNKLFVFYHAPHCYQRSSWRRRIAVSKRLSNKIIGHFAGDDDFGRKNYIAFLHFARAEVINTIHGQREFHCIRVTCDKDHRLSSCGADNANQPEIVPSSQRFRHLRQFMMNYSHIKVKGASQCHCST